MISFNTKRRALANLISARVLTGALALSSTLVCSQSYGVAVSFNGTYTQDFQSMTGDAAAPSTSGITHTTMTELTTRTGSENINGWYFYGLDTNNGPRWGINDGTSTTGQFGQMIDSTGGRALGSTGSGNNSGFFGIVLQNTTGSTINQFQLLYDAVMNVNPATTPNAFPVSWQITTTAPTTTQSTGVGTFNDAAGTWNATTFGFTTPTTGIGAPGPQFPNPPATTPISPLFKIDGTTKGGVISNAGWDNGEYLYIRWTEADESQSDAMAGVDNFSLIQIVAANVTWNTGAGTWNASTGNWLGGSPTTSLYKDQDNAIFNNSAAGGVITIQAGGVSPTSTLVNNDAAHPYIFQNTVGDTNGIKTGTFTKAGVGTVTLAGKNTFSGGVSVNGGTLIVSGGDDRLGNVSGSLGFGGGTVRTDGVGLTTTRGIVVGVGGGTFDTNGFNSALSGPGIINDALTKTGSGDLKLSGALTFGANGSFNINAGGTVTLGAVSGTTSMSNGGVFSGDLVYNSTARLNFNNAAKTYGGTGKIKVLGSSIGAGAGGVMIVNGSLPNTSALFSNLSGQTGGTITSDIILNPVGAGHVAFTPGDVTTSNYTTASFLMFMGGTNGATGDGLTINGQISGEGDLFIGNSSRNGGGAANITFNNANTYTGNTLFNTGGVVKIGVANALPTTTSIVQGSLSGGGNATLDLNGFNQQIVSLSDDAQNATIAKSLKITNNGLADSTLTISGSVTPVNAFNGTIVDGLTNKIGLTKSGSSTLTLTGVNAYSGNTTVSGGAVVFGGTGSTIGNVAIGAGSVTVQTGATLDVKDTTNSAGSGSLTVSSGGTFVANNLRADTVALDGAATIRTNGSATGASKVETLTISENAKLNLSDNDLVVGTAPNFNAVRTAIIAGKTINATAGITSDMTGFGISRGFGYAMGNDPKVSSLLAGSLSGQAFDTDSVLVKFTLLGDADLDGDTDLNDLGLWSNGYTGDLGANPPAPTTFWTGGDFDYDGDTDLNDLGLWSSTYTGDFNGGPGSLVVNAPGASPEAVAILNSMGFTVVPEPSTFVLAGVGLAGLAIAARRRRA